ncbi:MAG: putative porin [Novosphingobium sp.]
MAPARLKRVLGHSAALAALFVSGAAFAQAGPDAAQAAAAPAAQAAAPSPDAMTNLIRLLVAQGTITKENGDSLLAQAQFEADKARAAAAPPPPPPVADGAVRVSRVPEAVRAQIRDEIRGEIMAQAASEGWVTKNQAAPEWTKRIRVYGDIRVRSQSELYSKANSNQFLDFGRISELGPIDYGNTAFLPLLNSRVDRANRLRFRARLGVEAEVTKGVTAEFGLGTGDNNSPISENASLGGGFAKRDVWLDLANFKVSPTSWATFLFGRFHNPFNTSEMLYDNDLRFDGGAARFTFNDALGKGSAVALTGGAFPLDYGSPNFPDNALNKLSYPSRWLLAGELKIKGEVAENAVIEASGGYHRFTKVQGSLSAPCNLDTTDTCSTDAFAAQFLRKGNTLFAIRNLTANTAGISPQLLGLKFGYEILDFNLAARVPLSDGVGVRLDGSYVRNIGFRRRSLCDGQIDTNLSTLIQPINNVTANGTQTSVCTATKAATFNGGNQAWRAEAMIGTNPEARNISKKGEWGIGVEYRYVQSDAVLDALTDSDFHLGGTNTKGYILRGEYGIADGLVVAGRWLSSNEISGDPFAIDVLQIDLRAQF